MDFEYFDKLTLQFIKKGRKRGRNPILIRESESVTDYPQSIHLTSRFDLTLRAIKAKVAAFGSSESARTDLSIVALLR